MWSEIILKCILASLWHNYVKCKNAIWSKHWVHYWKAERISLTQIVYVVSCLLSNTSSKRILALRLLYSWYSSAMGIRSSFCAVLHYFGGEGKKKNKKKNRYRMKRMTLWDYTPIKTHLTLELPYWSSFVHQWIADKWKCILFKKKKKNSYIVYRNIVCFSSWWYYFVCHWLDVRYANSAELFWSLFSCFLPVHVHKEKSNKKYH